MASLGALVIELAANTARLQGDLGKAVNIAQGAARRFNTIFRGVAALAGAGSLGAVVARSIEMGDELNKAAIKAGVTGKAMSELAYVAKQSDVELSTLSTAIKNMQIALSQAGTGAKGPNEALAALGVTFGQLKGLSADKQFEVLADRISRLKDPADRARAAVDLFKRAGEQLLPAFDDGARGIRALREEAGRLGASFSDEQIKKLADADTAVKKLRASWEGFATSLVSNVAPALAATLDLLRGKAPGVNDDPIRRRMDQLRKDIRDLEAFDPENVALRRRDSATARVAANLATARKEMARLRALVAPGRGDRGEGVAPSVGYETAISGEETLTEIIVTHAKIRKDAVAEYYASLNEQTLTAVERETAYLDEVEASLDELLKAGKITADEYAARWSEALGTVLQEIKPVGQYLGDTAKQPIAELAEFALEAARNMQTAFANFLFDPFKDGLKGMLKGFIDTIRRMVAEAAAAKIFGAIGGAGGLAGSIGSLLGFASGGSFKVGGSGGTDSSLVAFKATPGEMVDVRTPGQSRGGIVQNISIDARGSSIESVKLLQASIPAIIRQAVDSARLAIRDDRSRGYA